MDIKLKTSRDAPLDHGVTPWLLFRGTVALDKCLPHMTTVLHLSLRVFLFLMHWESTCFSVKLHHRRAALPTSNGKNKCVPWIHFRPSLYELDFSKREREDVRTGRCEELPAVVSSERSARVVLTRKQLAQALQSGEGNTRKTRCLHATCVLCCFFFFLFLVYAKPARKKAACFLLHVVTHGGLLGLRLKYLEKVVLFSAL